MRYLILLSFLYSCCPKIVTSIKETTTIRDTISIEVRTKVIDTFIDTDTLRQVIQLECDSSGNVKIKASNVNKGKRSNLSTKLSNNILYNSFTCDSLSILTSYQDSVIHALREIKTNKETTNVVIQKEMPFWGWLLIGAAIAFAVYAKFT